MYGGLAYLSGQIPIDPATNQVIEGGISAQTERVLENMKAVLEACGASLESVLEDHGVPEGHGRFRAR